jgi:hypothetical protein
MTNISSPGDGSNISLRNDGTQPQNFKHNTPEGHYQNPKSYKYEYSYHDNRWYVKIRSAKATV